MDPSLLAQLKQLELCLKPSRASSMLGRHELHHRGRSLEFAGYREYRSGDDLRELDWKLLGRTQRHFIKQRDTHSPATALILLDTSPSMQLQSPDAEFSKLRAAQLLAFGLLFTLQRQGDRFGFQLLDGTPVSPPRSTRRAFFHALERLENPIPNEVPQLPTLRPLSFDHVYLISDLLRPRSQWESWLTALRLVGRECQCLRVLDPLELGKGGHLDYLQHLESPERKRQMQPADWSRYLENFESHRKQIHQFCRQQNLPLHECVTQKSVLNEIQKILLRL
ncbi:MAG TPA: hypothetical protein DGB85_00105 [Deltaproteobacteria bacterium]|nr:hypothetical protein [Deltaproteobacteria bacterium]